MKTIICGGRDYRLTSKDMMFLDFFHKEHTITSVISGGCDGADGDGELWASQNGIEIKLFEPDWKAKGKSAGPLRNEEMALAAEACIAFPGGAGTQDMIKRAIKHKLYTTVIRHA